MMLWFCFDGRRTKKLRAKKPKKMREILLKFSETSSLVLFRILDEMMSQSSLLAAFGRSIYRRNNMTRQNSTSPFVIREIQGRKPRAVVLILGFGGAKPRHVAKYAQLYHETLNCSTVAGTASNYDTFLHNDLALDDFALNAVKEVTQLLKNINSDDHLTPIVMHILSNGGAFVTERLGLMIQDINSEKDHDSDNDNDMMILFSRGLKKGYQIFDSAPCHLNFTSSFNVIKALMPNYWLGIPAATIYSFAYATNYTLAFMLQKSTVGDSFWNVLLKDTSCMQQGFIYTPCDPIADSTKIEEFVKAREDSGVHVMTKRLEYSKHVQHLRLHEQEYKEFIEMILTDMEDRNKD